MAIEYTNLEKIRLEKIRACGSRASSLTRLALSAHIPARTLCGILRLPRLPGRRKATRMTLTGRIRATRPMGKIIFTHIEDGYGRIQLFFRLNDLGEEQLDFFNREFDLGDFIQAQGVLFRTRTGEVTLRVQSFRMLSKAVTPLPAAKDELVDGQVVRHAALTEPELRYRQRYADLAVNPEVRRIFQARARRLSRLCANFWMGRASWK